MKVNQALTPILSTLVTSGILLVSLNAVSACPFSKSKDAATLTSGGSSTIISHQNKMLKMGIFAAGIATVAGVGAAAAYKFSRSRKNDAIVDQIVVDVVDDVQEFSQVETSPTTAEKELVLTR